MSTPMFLRRILPIFLLPTNHNPQIILRTSQSSLTYQFNKRCLQFFLLHKNTLIGFLFVSLFTCVNNDTRCCFSLSLLLLCCCCCCCFLFSLLRKLVVQRLPCRDPVKKVYYVRFSPFLIFILCPRGCVSELRFPRQSNSEKFFTFFIPQNVSGI